MPKIMEKRLRIAIQKSGRLSDGSIELLKSCGISISKGKHKLKSISNNFPIEILYLRDDDIPKYVAQNIADIGIIGQNVALEKGSELTISKHLGFSRCRLSLAIRREEDFNGLAWLNGKRIATSYPVILQDFFTQNNITAEIEEISGSVEIAPGIGLADAVCDIVSTGSTLMMNGLKEVYTVMKSEAVIVQSDVIDPVRNQILSKLLFRIDAVRKAKANKYILLNAPNDAITRIIEIIPGMKSPTVLPLAQEGWSSVHSVVAESDFWDVIDSLKDLGAEGILVIPIEKMMVN